MQVLAAEGQGVDVELGAIGQRDRTGCLFKAQIAREREEAVDLDLEVARGAHQRALRTFVVQRLDLGRHAVGHLAAGGDVERNGVVDHRAVAAHIDLELEVFGANVHQRQAQLGGRGRGGRQAQPGARRQRAHLHRVLEQGQAQVQTGQLKARRAGVGHLAHQTAIVIAVEAVRAVEAHKGVQVVAADDPAVGRDRAALGDGDLPDTAREREAPVDRHKVGRLHRHAGVVELARAEVRRVEEGAQGVFIGLAVRGDAQRVGRRPLDHLKVQAHREVALELRAELEQAAAVVVAKQARARAKAPHHRAGLDQAVAARQARLHALGQLDVDHAAVGGRRRGAAVFNRQRASDLQLVVLVVVLAAELQRQALVGGDGLVAHDTDHAG